MNEYSEIILLWPSRQDSWLLRKQPKDTALHPAMLVVPGGGYGGVCIDTEDYPVADRNEFKIIHR